MQNFTHGQHSVLLTITPRPKSARGYCHHWRLSVRLSVHPSTIKNFVVDWPRGSESTLLFPLWLRFSSVLWPVDFMWLWAGSLLFQRLLYSQVKSKGHSLWEFVSDVAIFLYFLIMTRLNNRSFLTKLVNMYLAYLSFCAVAQFCLWHHLTQLLASNVCNLDWQVDTRNISLRKYTSSRRLFVCGKLFEN